MAFAEYLQLVKKVELAALAGAPANAALFTLESGTPYRHCTSWVHVAGAGIINVDVQPLIGGANDGAVVNFSSSGVKKVFQVTPEELRPATRFNISDPTQIPFIIKSELQITNKGANPVVISVYMLAAAAPGGA